MKAYGGFLVLHLVGFSFFVSVHGNENVVASAFLGRSCGNEERLVDEGLADEELVDERLKKIMTRSAERVLKMSKRLNCNMRIASYASAIEHIDKVYELRGVFP